MNKSKLQIKNNHFQQTFRENPIFRNLQCRSCSIIMDIWILDALQITNEMYIIVFCLTICK